MLTVKKDFPPNQIGIRPSMCKFPSNHRLLEIKQVAHAKTGSDKSLFFPAILIMKHLGVEPGVFLDLQRLAWAKIAIQYDADASRLLQKPVDFDDVSRYMQRVVGGSKVDGTTFCLWKLEEIIRKMEEGKKSDVKVNLQCSISLYQGILGKSAST